MSKKKYKVRAECPACSCGDVSFLGPEKLREKFIGNEDEIENKIRYTLTPEVSYQFNKNISGGLTSNYEFTDNKKQGSTLRTFRLGIFVEILF